MCVSKLDVYGYLSNRLFLEGMSHGPSCYRKYFLHVIPQTSLKALTCAPLISSSDYLVGDTRFWEV